MAFFKRTWAEIDTSALLHNYKIIKESAKDCFLMAVVKADAYGHGTDIVIPTLLKAGAEHFAVSNIDEAMELRRLGVTGEILILGYTPPEAANILAENNITQALYDTSFAKELSYFAKKENVKIKVHLKLDTGMGRIGFNFRNEEFSGLNEVLEVLNLEGIIAEGVFTHFSSADRSGENDIPFTEKQYNLFLSAAAKLKECGFTPKYTHCCNSAALLLEKNKHLSFCRPGIILYGLKPDNNLVLEEELIPVMTLKSVVSMVKEIEKDTPVSYSRTFVSKEKMKVATVSIGYADGYPRLLSNKGEVVIKGQKAKIIGNVCMDQITVDVSHIENVNMGDEVTLFGKELSAEKLAQLCSTISYEIVCGVSKRVPRIAVK